MIKLTRFHLSRPVSVDKVIPSFSSLIRKISWFTQLKDPISPLIGREKRPYCIRLCCYTHIGD